ncbi:hypothetical protein J6590_026966 [Homalodisca vitripennis]|nr:hypothetical protein J6590_026966 [Homalodisca vitripennis]
MPYVNTLSLPRQPSRSPLQINSRLNMCGRYLHAKLCAPSTLDVTTVLPYWVSSRVLSGGSGIGPQNNCSYWEHVQEDTDILGSIIAKIDSYPFPLPINSHLCTSLTEHCVVRGVASGPVCPLIAGPSRFLPRNSAVRSPKLRGPKNWARTNPI